MYLYYLVDFRNSKPKILFINFSQEPVFKSFPKSDKIVYLRIPIKNINRIEQIRNLNSHQQLSLRLYIFHLNCREFLCSIGQTIEDACIGTQITPKHYESYPLNEIPFIGGGSQ